MNDKATLQLYLISACIEVGSARAILRRWIRQGLPVLRDADVTVLCINKRATLLARPNEVFTVLAMHDEFLKRPNPYKVLFRYLCQANSLNVDVCT